LSGRSGGAPLGGSPAGGGEPAPAAFSLGTKLFSEAQASTSVPSTVKCSSESKGATSRCSRMTFRNLRAMSASSRRSRFFQ
jgi:hypothetical protein